MSALDYIVRSGRALYVGISNYNSAQTREASSILKSLGTPCVINQPSYSMFNRWVEDDGLLETLREEGIGCIPFSPLSQGMLTDKYLAGIPSDSRAASETGFLKADQVSSDLVRKAKSLQELSAARGQTLAQMALAWVLRHPAVTSALIGASKVAQVEDAVGLLEKPNFASDELQLIESILKT